MDDPVPSVYFDRDKINETATALVREFLNRKGCMNTMKVLDEELPRTQRSICNRAELAQTLHIGPLIRKNKQLATPFRTMVEILVWDIFKCHHRMLKQNSSGTPSPEIVRRSVNSPTAQDVRLNEQSRTIINSNLNNNHSSVTPKATLVQSTVYQGSLSTKNQSSVSEPQHNKAHVKFSEDEDESKPLRSVLLSHHNGPPNPRPKSSRGRPKTADSTMSHNKSSAKKQVSSVSEMLAATPDKILLNKKTGAHGTKSTTKPNCSSGTIEDDKDLEDVLLDVDVETDYSPETFDWLERRPIKTEKPVPKTKKNFSKIQKPVSNNNDDVISGGMTMDLAIKLRKLIFGSSDSCGFNAAWTGQNFQFNDCTDGRSRSLRCGIIQLLGGPCGVLAVVQSFFLKHLIFGSDEPATTDILTVNDSSRRVILSSAIADIVWRCKTQSSVSLALLTPIKQFTPIGKHSLDGVTEYVTFVKCPTYSNLKKVILENISCFENGRGACILLLYSVIMSRSVDQVQLDMDEKTSTLIGAHSYCTQELVNLLVCGQACSNVFDDVVILDGNKKLQGVSSQCEVGLLSLFEHYGSCRVGENLKSPKYPIWIVCSESHYSVLFALDKQPLVYGTPLFDLYYYDGLANQDEEIRLTVECGAGFVPHGRDLTPPLEHCIRTRWSGSKVDWNGTEPLL